jgi:hypothetical protein
MSLGTTVLNRGGRGTRRSQPGCRQSCAGRGRRADPRRGTDDGVWSWRWMRLGADPVGVVAGRDEQLDGGLVADTHPSRSNPGVPAVDVSTMEHPVGGDRRSRPHRIPVGRQRGANEPHRGSSTEPKISCRAMVMSLVTSASTYQSLFRGLVGSDFSQRLAVDRPLEDLARRALRQLVDELNDSRNLVGRQPLSRPRRDRGSVLG